MQREEALRCTFSCNEGETRSILVSREMKDLVHKGACVKAKICKHVRSIMQYHYYYSNLYSNISASRFFFHLEPSYLSRKYQIELELDETQIVASC